jgi:hypothetical protein
MTDMNIGEHIGDIVAGIAALGTAAFGIIDAAKPFWGGPSNFGFGHIKNALHPFDEALKQGIAPGVAWSTLKSNWLNGVVLADQKAAAKALIRLSVSPETAPILARATKLNAVTFATVAEKIRAGTPLVEQEVGLLGEFDAVVSAILDAGYERADQKYRNTAKFLAALVAIVLALIGGSIVSKNMATPPADGYVNSDLFWLSFVVGLIAVPIAPVAKDLTTALVSAVSVLKR